LFVICDLGSLKDDSDFRQNDVMLNRHPELDSGSS